MYGSRFLPNVDQSGEFSIIGGQRQIIVMKYFWNYRNGSHEIGRDFQDKYYKSDL